jgi:hypothetical protein
MNVNTALATWLLFLADFKASHHWNHSTSAALCGFGIQSILNDSLLTQPVAFFLYFFTQFIILLFLGSRAVG